MLQNSPADRPTQLENTVAKQKKMQQNMSPLRKKTLF